MINKIYIIFYTVCFFILSCDFSQDRSELATCSEIFLSDNIQKNDSSLMLLIDSVRTLNLSIGDSGEFIYDIDKILFKDDNLYIVDKFGKQIVKYDNNGKHIFSLSKRGKGNGEYLFLNDATIIGESIYVLDALSGFLIKYSTFDGHFISKYKINVVGTVMSDVKDNLVLFNENKDYLSNNNVIIMDTCGIIKNEYMAISKINKGTAFGLNSIFFKSDTCLYLLNCFDDYLYDINFETYTPRYKLNFGDFAIPESKIKQISRSDDRNKMLKIESLLSSLEYNMLFDYYSVLSDYIIGSSNRGKHRTYTVFNKSTNSTINIEEKNVPIEFSWHVASKGNVAYSRVNYAVIKPIFDQNANIVTNIKDKIIEHFANAHLEETNPLLVITYFKNVEK